MRMTREAGPPPSDLRIVSCKRLLGPSVLSSDLPLRSLFKLAYLLHEKIHEG